ncbi:MAG: exosortase/archaeosortase family protein [Candidatus Bathyarchaeota archaeon]|nr:MAG: exosortase/archaeosortase family protein [Candidatus Bathyarchaeota archaeon]
MPSLSASFRALKSRLSLFYLLAFLPLVPIEYFSYIMGRSVLSVLVPFYGFVLLFLKKDRLGQFSNPGLTQQVIGGASMVAGFLAYYLALQIRFSNFYEVGAAFYAIYIIGLFLAFFALPALKLSISVLFLVVAGGCSFYMGGWLEFYMEPLVPFFVQLMVSVLWVLGIPAFIQTPTMIMLETSRGFVPVVFEAGCVGIQSFLVFAVIVVITMMEEQASIPTRFLWSVGGVVGMFLMNILRVSMIAAVIYYFGYDRWGEIHSWIGYALFLLWLAVFLTLFSRREGIHARVQAWRQKL